MSSLVPSTISLLIKPAGPDCNLRCTYCFYRQKSGMFPDTKVHRMTDETLERTISQAMDAGRDFAMFSWQGGEPTLMGLEFFKRAAQLQGENLHQGQIVSNSLQTNGTLIDRKWAEFLKEYNFLVGVSLDGPAGIHNHYRRDENKSPTHAKVMRNLQMMLDVGVEVNILTLLNERNVKEPDRVYEFLLKTGVKYFQFVPCVEPGPGGKPAFFSITPEEYGDFLCRLFDLWLDSSMDISIRDFDDLMMLFQGQRPNTCIWGPTCGMYVVVEHTGDVFPCDFFVLPKWKLGNVNETTLAEIIYSEKIREFGDEKTKYSEECAGCEWLRFCHGGCLKHRLLIGCASPEQTYFCKSYKQLFEHSRSVLDEIHSQAPEHKPTAENV